MDCSVCRIRSSASFCVECQALLCEECGESCDECRKRICSAHTHLSRSGRPLCVTCYTEYVDHRQRLEREGPGLVPVGEEDPEHRDRLRALRARSDIRPWKVSLGFAVAAVATISVLLGLPAFRELVLGYTGAYTAAFVVLVCPALALVWALVGLLQRNPPESRMFNALGIVLALVATGMAYPVLREAPAPEATMEARLAVEEPQEVNLEEMTPEEREAWRRGRLELYRLRP